MYSNVVNEADIETGEYFMMTAVNVEMDDALAYELTSQFWSNLEQAVDDIALLGAIDASIPLQGVNIRRHPGAIRYYEEQGFEIPEALR